MPRVDLEKSHVAPSLPVQPTIPTQYHYDTDVPPPTSTVAIRTVSKDVLEDGREDRSGALIRALQAMQHASPPPPTGGMPLETTVLAAELYLMFHAIRQSQFEENMDKTATLKEELSETTKERLKTVTAVAEKTAQAQKWSGAGTVANVFVHIGAAIMTPGGLAVIPFMIASLPLILSLDDTFNEGSLQKTALDSMGVPEGMQGTIKTGSQVIVGIVSMFVGVRSASAIPQFIKATFSYFQLLCSGLQSYNDILKIQGQGALTQLDKVNLALSTGLERALQDLQQTLSGLQSTAKNTSKILANAGHNAEGIIRSTARG